MNSHHSFRSAAAIALFSCAFALSEAACAVLSSPDGRIRVTVSIKEKLDPYPAGNRLYYSISFKGKDILLDSPFGLDFKDHAPFAKNLSVMNETRSSGAETWEAVTGKSRLIRNRFNEMRLSLRETDPPNRRMDLIFRASDDGVAFRYFLPEQEALKDFKLTAERIAPGSDLTSRRPARGLTPARVDA
jgi:alpha-glucosidase